VVPGPVRDGGGDDRGLVVALIVVGALVVVAGGLAVWSRVRRAKEGSQS
jgi:hypothetical protein